MRDKTSTLVALPSEQPAPPAQRLVRPAGSHAPPSATGSSSRCTSRWSSRRVTRAVVIASACAATGDDANDGSEAAPWQTLQHAADTVDADADGQPAHVGFTQAVGEWVPARDNQPSDDPVDIAARDRLVHVYHLLFVEALRQGAFDPDFAHAVVVHEVLESLLRSSREGCAVAVQAA